jgi:hypothetical protein
MASLNVGNQPEAVACGHALEDCSCPNAAGRDQPYQQPPSKEKAPEAQGPGRFFTPIYLKLDSLQPRFSGIAPLPWSRSVP